MPRLCGFYPGICITTEEKAWKTPVRVVINEDGSWRIRMNYELNELIENADIVRFIKSRRIAWLGRVMRMDDKRTPKRTLEWKPIGMRIRWILENQNEL